MLKACTRQKAFLLFFHVHIGMAGGSRFVSVVQSLRMVKGWAVQYVELFIASGSSLRESRRTHVPRIFLTAKAWECARHRKAVHEWHAARSFSLLQMS